MFCTHMYSNAYVQIVTIVLGAAGCGICFLVAIFALGISVCVCRVFVVRFRVFVVRVRVCGLRSHAHMHMNTCMHVILRKHLILQV